MLKVLEEHNESAPFIIELEVPKGEKPEFAICVGINEDNHYIAMHIRSGTLITVKQEHVIEYSGHLVLTRYLYKSKDGTWFLGTWHSKKINLSTGEILLNKDQEEELGLKYEPMARVRITNE